MLRPRRIRRVQNRASRFLVNLGTRPETRSWDESKRCTPTAPKGSLPSVRIRRGPEGDQVLDDADDGMIGASVGFGVLPEHQRWETRSRRKIMRAFLDHIGLTFTPAYAGAGVLAVRSGTSRSCHRRRRRRCGARRPTSTRSCWTGWWRRATLRRRQLNASATESRQGGDC